MPMPKKKAQDTEKDYVSRAMGDPEMVKDYPDQAQRAAVAFKEYRGNAVADDEMKELLKQIMAEPAKPRKNSDAVCPVCDKDEGNWVDLVAHLRATHHMEDAEAKRVGGDLRRKRENAMGQKGDVIPMRFIQPGLVRYADVGDVLIRKETFDRMARTFVGKPVFNETHKETTSKDFSSGRADGVITRVWFEPADGWFWADAMVWDPETKENCRNGYSVSCAYDVLKWSDGPGITNNIPYQREVLDGEYTHMAVVSNPRYEGARIIYNTQGGSMKLAFWKRDKVNPEVRNASEVDTDQATLEIDGQKVPLKDAIELYNSVQATKKAEAEKAAGALANAMKDDDEIEVGGEKVTVKNLKDAYVTARKNADEKDKKDKADEERKNAEAEEEKKKEEDRKNAEDKAKKDAEEEERKNAAAGQGHFDKIRNAANDRKHVATPAALLTKEDRIEEGARRYGSGH